MMNEIMAFLCGTGVGGTLVFIFNLAFRHAVENAVKAEIAKLEAAAKAKVTAVATEVVAKV